MNAIQLALRGKQDLAFSPPVTFVNRYYSSSNHAVRGAQLSFRMIRKSSLRPVPDLLANTSHPSRLLLNAGYKPVEMKRASSKPELCIEDVARLSKILGGSKFSCKLSLDHRVEANITRRRRQCNKKIACDVRILPNFRNPLIVRLTAVKMRNLPARTRKIRRNFRSSLSISTQLILPFFHAA